MYALATHSAFGLASGGYDGVVRLWDVRAARLQHKLHDHAAPVRALLVEPSTRALWSADSDGTICVHSHEATR